MYIPIIALIILFFISPDAALLLLAIWLLFAHPVIAIVIFLILFLIHCLNDD